MYLKRIELLGFKSFAQKTKFEFHSGITGIVGPNGSGKSNVSDAVRWVLGEQSAKQLRGSNMQDVIFAGTENRKPVSYASVSLIMDNSDHVLDIAYDEVTVTRKIYRSGESEYLLNGTICRLKDIQELFYDTGVGKEGYSLIGQGQIEKILNGKPQERRELFDEAAGIVKFKRRKATALKKLENEQENLLRVNDIIYELEKQVGPLKNQSEKAKIYLQKRDELKILDLQLYALRSERYQKELLETNEALENLAAEIAEVTEKYEKEKEDSAKMEAAVSNLDMQIQNLQNELSELVVQKNGYLHQIDLIDAQLRAEQLSDQHYQTRLDDLESSLTMHREEKADHEQRIENLSASLTDTMNMRGQLQQKLSDLRKSAQVDQDRLDNIQVEILSLLEQKTSAESARQHYDTLMQQNQLQKDKLSQEKEQYALEVEKRRDELQEWKQKLSDQSAAKEANKDKLSQLEDSLVSYTKKRNELAEQIAQIGRDLVRNQSRLESLSNLAERYEGYGNAVRRVMERKDPGVVGVVADILKVKQQYETAIETALGGSIQNIVTEDEDSARRMIDYLKKNRLGRATFLPMTAVTGRGSAREDDVREEGVIGTADTLVEADSRFSGIISSLLGGILVVDTIDHAQKIARKYRFSLRIVTLEGEYLRPGGSMSGGAFKNNSNLLGRNRELELLRKKGQEIQQRQDALLAQQQDVVNSRTAAREEIEQIKGTLAQQEVQENTARINVSRLEDVLRQHEASLARNKEEEDALTSSLAQAKEKNVGTAETITQLEERRKQLEEESKQLESALEESTTLTTRTAREAEDANLKSQSLQQNLNFQKENLSRVQAQIENELQEKETILASRSSKEDSDAIKAQQKEELQQKVRDCENAHEEKKIALADTQKAREDLNASYKAFFEEREAMTKHIAELEKEEFRLSTKKEQTEQDIEKQDAYLWDEYELTGREAMQQKQDTDESLSSLRQKTKELKGQIKSLGSVNVNAIEEYKEVSERYEFLTAQRKDMEVARENLEKMIQSLETGMKRQFREQFDRIQKEFQKVFQELFGGGSGTLNLVDAENPLEAGIEVIAQPPGKKLQNMMQLSGGEKAMTAIALLFAIQNLKPSPFCILDEIEAALDEPNVDRFAQYLKNLCQNTQFIVITHRRGSMAAADRLYGITMQEKGVSTQVSVNLEEAEATVSKENEES